MSWRNIHEENPVLSEDLQYIAHHLMPVAMPHVAQLWNRYDVPLEARREIIRSLPHRFAREWNDLMPFIQLGTIQQATPQQFFDFATGYTAGYMGQPAGTTVMPHNEISEIGYQAGYQTSHRDETSSQSSEEAHEEEDHQTDDEHGSGFPRIWRRPHRQF